MDKAGKKLAPRILVVDDHFIVRQGVKNMISLAFPDATLGEAANGQQTVEKITHDEWDVVLLDISMPGRGGLDLLRSIKEERPKTAVIVLTMYPEDQFAVRVLRNGACCYLTKEAAGSEIIEAIRAALEGKKYILPSVAEKLARHLERDKQKLPHETLSDREYLILCMIASGKRVKEISSELFLSVKTVSTYRARLLKKMNLANNAEAMRYAVQNRLVELELRDAAPKEDAE